MNRGAAAQRPGIALFHSPEYECPYLPGRRARSAIVDPAVPLSRTLYTRLVEHGFRRSGDAIYRPACGTCSACIPIRIPVRDLALRRTDERALRRNDDLQVTAERPHFDAEHFALYRRYTRQRHPGGGMDDSDAGEYMSFLTSRWAETQLYVFRDREHQVKACLVLDRLDDALSAIYSFYDPDSPGRSLGRYMVLWATGEARRQGLDWLYLGYWVHGCRKMAYKDQFRPLEALHGGRWVRYARHVTLPRSAS